ncbi:helix-turn-helix domain-containing protein [Pseudomonas sp. MS15a(2019)]|uniref:helix-turn-helix domain-containing protein n=1 Tax=Pseudomonas sp. MS15a(2019) TaxID=2579938 RepID=UPI0015677B46|nr:helix-turn-helix domain-containing protein [Pseudomonas sp. MS15a(2019)]NRH40637.1 helix-turn-helix domain-containing protein [Pseudomonas sp. MS15a(2019)]
MQHIDIQAQAQQLRNEGFSVREVAEQIGKHYSWVSRNTTATNATPRNTRATKSVATSKRDIAVTQALAKASSPEGCNTSEFNDIIKAVYGVVRDEDTGSYVVDCTFEEKKGIRRRVKELAAREGKTALFFEDFISREAPEHSLQLMLTLAQGVHEAVELAVAEFREVYPEASVYSVQQALKGMAVQGYRPESVEAFCERAATAAHALQQVAPAVETVETVTEHTDEFLADLADIDAELFGEQADNEPEEEEMIVEAPMPKAPLAEAVVLAVIEWPVATEVVTEVVAEETELSLDDLDDDESLINYEAVDTDYDYTPEEFVDDMSIDERYEHNETTAQAIRDLFKQRADERQERARGKRPTDWAIKQQEEDEFYALLVDAESHNENFIF